MQTPRAPHIPGPRYMKCARIIALHCAGHNIVARMKKYCIYIYPPLLHDRRAFDFFDEIYSTEAFAYKYYK